MEHLEKLVKAFISGDKTAFEEIYKETYKGVYYTCITFLGDEKDAEDISQEVYLAFLASADKLEEPAKLKSWLATVAANKCRNYLKKEKPVLMEDELMEGLRVETDELLLPEEYVTNQAKRRIVMDIMKEELSKVQYQTMVLFYFNNLSIQQIADIMECPTGTVTYRLSVARDRIRAGIEQYEKKSGDKLYSVSLVPALALLFANEAQAMEPANMCAKILAASGYHRASVAMVVQGGGKAMLATMKGKLILFGLFLLVSVGGIGTVLLLSKQPESKESDTDVVAEGTVSQEQESETGMSADASKAAGEEETIWQAEANADYFTWAGTKITGWSDLGLEQTAVIIPAQCTELALWALSNHPTLEYVAFEGDTVIWGTFVFSKCPSLKEAHLPAKATEVPKDAFSDCTALEKVVLPEGLITIEVRAFTGCTALKSITLPETVTTIGNSAFWQSGITELILPDSVTSIGSGAFKSTALERVQFGTGLEVITEFAFAYCESLTEVTIPASVVTIDEYAFDTCKNLTTLTFEEGNLKTIKKRAFGYCDSLTEVRLPEGLACIEKHAFTRIMA